MAENKIRLRIVTPERNLYDEEVEMVIMRATSGDIAFLYGHAPITTTLSYGVMRIIVGGGKELRATVFGGFAEVMPSHITILSDTAEWPEEIDPNRAQEAKERAEERIRTHSDDIDVKRAELALRRALLRIDAAGTSAKRH